MYCESCKELETHIEYMAKKLGIERTEQERLRERERTATRIFQNILKHGYGAWAREVKEWLEG